jgi:hypothetical protein
VIFLFGWCISSRKKSSGFCLQQAGASDVYIVGGAVGSRHCAKIPILKRPSHDFILAVGQPGTIISLGQQVLVKP